MMKDRAKIAGVPVALALIVAASGCASGEKSTSDEATAAKSSTNASPAPSAPADETKIDDTQASPATGEVETQVRDELAVLREMGTVALIEDSIAGGARPKALLDATDQAFKKGMITETGLCISLVVINEAAKARGVDVSDARIVDQCVRALADGDD